MPWMRLSEPAEGALATDLSGFMQIMAEAISTAGPAFENAGKQLHQMTLWTEMRRLQDEWDLFRHSGPHVSAQVLADLDALEDECRAAGTPVFRGVRHAIDLLRLRIVDGEGETR